MQMSSSLFMLGFILPGHGFTYFGCTDSPLTQIQGVSKKLSISELSICRVCRFDIPPRFLQRSSDPKSCLAQFRQFSIGRTIWHRILKCFITLLLHCTMQQGLTFLEEGVFHRQNGSQNIRCYKCSDICFYNFCEKLPLIWKNRF